MSKGVIFPKTMASETCFKVSGELAWAHEKLHDREKPRDLLQKEKKYIYLFPNLSTSMQ